MQIREWIEGVMRTGSVCVDYMRKIRAVETPFEVFRVLCDANGGRWLFEMHNKNPRLVPVGEFMNEYASYINGGKKMEYPQGYTSKFYCRATEPDIDADTTLVYLLECMDMEVYVPRNKYPSVIMSDGSQGDIVLGDGARVNIELYGDARVNIVGDASKARITRH